MRKQLFEIQVTREIKMILDLKNLAKEQKPFLVAVLQMSYSSTP